MLVVTRKAQEKLTFPQLGITVHFLRVQSGNIKVGIEAPRDINIVRDDASGDAIDAAELVRKQLLRLPREVRHAIRNDLHQVSLGLHLYKELVKAGMTTEAEDTFNDIREALQRLDQSEILQSASAAAKPTNGTIVVIEDNDNERGMLAGFLRLKGYQVLAFSDGQEALDHFAANDIPGVVLVDMQMPRCDGPTTVRSLRHSEGFEDTPIFAISGSSSQEAGLPVGRDGVDLWFLKPLDVASLVTAIESRRSADA